MLGPGGEHAGAVDVERGAQWSRWGLAEGDEEQPVPRLEVGWDEAPLRVVDDVAVG